MCDGNRGSFPVTVTESPLVTTGHAHREWALSPAVMGIGSVPGNSTNMGFFFFDNGNRGSFPVTVTGPPSVTALIKALRGTCYRR